MSARTNSMAAEAGGFLPAGRGDRLVVAVSLIFMLLLSAVLWREWKANPDLSHGFFTPLLVIVLLMEARTGGPRRHPRTGWMLRTGSAVLLLAGVAALAAAGLWAAQLGWGSQIALFALAASTWLMLAGAWLHLCGGSTAWMPLNYTALAGISLWVLAAPLPPGTYNTLTLHLRTMVTSGVLETLHMLGIPARQQGNLIELGNAVVGVEEACSGIRSLLSCVYAAVFFSAWRVRRWRRRMFILAAAPLLAVGMNFLRSLALTLMARQGVNISGFWHDATGFAILALTALVLAVLAFSLETGGAQPGQAVEKDAGCGVDGQPLPAGDRTGRRIVFAGQAAAILLTALFILQARPRDEGLDIPPPKLGELLPDAIPGWVVATSDDLFRFSRTLQTGDLLQRTYLADDAEGPCQITLYIAYWPPGKASPSLVATHTPDACWPGAGWEMDGRDSLPEIRTAGGTRLPPPEYRHFTKPGLEQHVWYWHLLGGRQVGRNDPRAPWQLLRFALEQGFHEEGEQYFIRLSSNRPWEEISGKAPVEEMFSRLRTIGLEALPTLKE